MKKLVTFCLILCMFGCMWLVADASEKITVDTNTMNIVVDGNRVYSDNFVYNNTTYVPLRKIAEMLGKKVEWDQTSNSALINDSENVVTSEDTTSGLDSQRNVVVSVDKNLMNIVVNGSRVNADNFVYNNTTYVPLRAISEMFNQKIDWERISNTAHIGKPGISIFDGKPLGKVNEIEFTDYIYDYYGSMYESEFEYYTTYDENPADYLGSSKEEFVKNKILFDYTVISCALEKGYSMRPYVNARYYESVASTLKGVKGDEEKFNRMLEMQGFTTLNSYYYAMLVSDLYVQLCQPYIDLITEEQIYEFYQNNSDLASQYTFEESAEDISFILARNLFDEFINKETVKYTYVKY